MVNMTLHFPESFDDSLIGSYVAVTLKSGHNVNGYVDDMTCDNLAVELSTMPGHLIHAVEMVKLMVWS